MSQTHSTDRAGEYEPTRVPPKGSEERAFWLEAAAFHGFEQTCGGEEIPEYDPPAYFATEAEVLALMAASRDQGRRDAGLASQPTARRDMATPEGWVLVPREPTLAMIGAGRRWEEGSRSAWSAMLDSVPPAPTPEVGSDLAKLVAAAEPFANCIYNDNGDIAVSNTYRITHDQWCDLYFAHRQAKDASTSHSPPPAEDLAGQGEPVANLRERLGQPHCWVLPGQDTANLYGYIDAHCCEEGELSKPLWSLESIRDVIAAPAPSRSADREEIARVLRQKLAASSSHDSVGRVVCWINGIDEAADAILALRDAPRDGGDGWSTDMEAGK